MTFKGYRTPIIVVTIVIGSWLLADFYAEQNPDAAKEVIPHSPDYFSRGYYKKEMDNQGLIKSELTADAMFHYSDDGTTHLENPIMTLYNDETSPWVIQAENGILEADGEHLFLAGKVFIQRDSAKGDLPFIINTSELQVNLATSFAKTHLWGEVIDGKNKTSGVGMEAFFIEPIRLKFLSQVKGRYEFN